MPDHALAQRFRRLLRIFSATHPPKQRALRYSSSGHPGVDRNLDKRRDGHGPYPLSLAHQVDKHPAAVTLLDVPAVERRELAAAQGAPQKRRQNRTVPFSFG